MHKSLFKTVLLIGLILSLLLTSCSSSGSIASLGSKGIYVGSTTSGPNQYVIFVDLKPARSTAPADYDVDLYQNGVFRATTTVSFSQLAIKARSDTMVSFPASANEYNTYLAKNVNNIFSVKVHNLTQQQMIQMEQ